MTENHNLNTSASVNFHGVPLEKVLQTAEVWGVPVHAQMTCGAPHVWCTIAGRGGVSVSFNHADTDKAEAYILQNGVS